MLEVTASEELNSDEDSTTSDDAESEKFRKPSENTNAPDESRTRRYEISVMLMLQVAILLIAVCAL